MEEMRLPSQHAYPLKSYTKLFVIRTCKRIMAPTCTLGSVLPVLIVLPLILKSDVGFDTKGVKLCFPMHGAAAPL